MGNHQGVHLEALILGSKIFELLIYQKRIKAYHQAVKMEEEESTLKWRKEKMVALVQWQINIVHLTNIIHYNIEMLKCLLKVLTR